MAMAKRRRISLWSRDEILCCRCADLPTVHIHCPCDSCSGKAVNRSTEYRHWASTRDYLHGVVVQSNNDSSDEGLVHVEQDKAGEVEEGALQVVARVVETQSQDECACVSQSLSTDVDGEGTVQSDGQYMERETLQDAAQLTEEETNNIGGQCRERAMQNQSQQESSSSSATEGLELEVHSHQQDG